MTADHLVFPDQERERTVPKLALWASRRIGKNQNVIAVFTGPTGSGKSYSALRFAELCSAQLDVPFSGAHVVFEPAELLELINTGGLVPGSVIILDEGGVAVNSRTFMSKANQAINFLAQTFRHRNYILLVCVPDFAFLDKAVRRLVHVVVETERIDRKDGVCWTKPLVLQVNQRSGTTFFKFLRYYDGSGAMEKLERQGFRLPSRALRDEYEERKTAYTTALYERLAKTLAPEEAQSPADKRKALTAIQARAYYLKERHNLSDEDVGRVLGVSRVTASEHLRAVRRKGFDLEDFRGRPPGPPGDIEPLRAEIKDLARDWYKQSVEGE